MSETNTYTVSGLHCSGCVASVSEEVREIPGVENVDLVLETGALTVTTNQSVDDDAVKAAVEEAGYQLA
jgi:copper chaperone CopZ